MTKYHILIISFCIILLNTNFFRFIPEPVVNENPVYIVNPQVRYDFTKLRDTLYTLSNYILEVNLKTHQGKLRSKDGWVKEFPVSGGTDKVDKGIETKEGLFSIHSKSPKLYSVQFDSTVMLNWMGFNFGIGFHALEGNGYYRYLGKKNVSHGCLRISREDAIQIYKLISIGTPVLVHSGNSAICLEFGNQDEVYKYYSFSELKQILPERLKKLYNGEYLITENQKILVDDVNLFHSGLELGDATRVPERQLIKPATLWFDKNLSEAEYSDYLTVNNRTVGLRYTFNTQLDSLLASK
jgi:L,D-transpeptidase catalytic domain